MQLRTANCKSTALQQAWNQNSANNFTHYFLAQHPLMGRSGNKENCECDLFKHIFLCQTPIICYCLGWFAVKSFGQRNTCVCECVVCVSLFPLLLPPSSLQIYLYSTKLWSTDMLLLPPPLAQQASNRLL